MVLKIEERKPAVSGEAAGLVMCVCRRLAYFFDLKVQSDFVDYLFRARSIATAIATLAPTIGLLPIPRKPIIST